MITGGGGRRAVGGGVAVGGVLGSAEIGEGDSTGNTPHHTGRGKKKKGRTTTHYPVDEGGKAGQN